MVFSRSSMGAIGTPQRRTYRAEAASVALPLTRGLGVSYGTAEDQVKLSTGVGARCAGVVEETVSVANAPVSIIKRGECIGIAGQAAITVGMELKMDADGKFVTAEAADNERCGRAVSAAALEDDEFVIDVSLRGDRS